MKYVVFALFLLSALALPWWFVVPFGIVVSTLSGGVYVAIGGGVLLDQLYGAPIPLLGDTSAIYTITFMCIALFITFLSERVVD